jgi:coenzyme F420 hydrogenase subunit beta
MPFSELKSQILDEDMCTRCGACVAVCPPAWLMVGDDGSPATTLAPSLMSCGECSLCIEVCPGRDTATPQSEQRIFGRTRTREERWTGIFRQSLHLASTDPRVLRGSAAGGAGTSLLLAALRSGLADGAIVIGRDTVRAWVPSALVTDDEEIVMRCGQTSYCITPNVQLLRDARFSRIAIIGVPCEIQAVQRMKNLAPPPDVAEKVVLTLEIACASSTRRAGTEHLITERLGLALEDVAEMRYRDGEYPGEFAVWTKKGDRVALPFHELVDDFKRFKTHRCLVCADWWSGLADISISDGDPNIYATSQSGDTPPRESKVMVRTDQGERIIDTAVNLGMVSVRPVPFAFSENLGLQRKRFRYAAFAQSMPDRVPSPPVEYEETEALLSDNEVIDRMAQHDPIGATPRDGRSIVRISSGGAAQTETTWTPPGDKSISQRLAFAAALSNGTSTIRNLLRSEDTDNNLAILRQLGVDIWEAADGSFVIGGRGLRGLTAPPPGIVLNPGNSATTARILISLLAGTPGEFSVDGNDLLRHRPMEWIVDPLRTAGADIDYLSERGRLPVRIRGQHLASINHHVKVFSAQPVSALLFAGLQASGPTVIHRRVKARDHTERLLRYLGADIDEAETVVRLSPPHHLPAFDLTVPGDISGAAFPAACVVLSPHPRMLVIENVGVNETRTGFLRTLQAMGADIEIQSTAETGGEPVGRIVVRSGASLRGIEVSGDALIQSMIDELPLLAAVAARAEGNTTIRNARELRDKDTDRIATTVAALRPFGVRIEPCEDGFDILESVVSSPKEIALPPDHRVIFAAMALASSLPEPTSMSGWERVRVSFPECLEILGQLAAVDRTEQR